MKQNKKDKLFIKPLFILFALLAVTGLVCWYLQLTQGLQLTNLNNYNTWGLYIAGFAIFTGVASGSLIFSSSAYLFPSISEFKPYARIAAFVGAIGSVVAAGLFVIVDIGNPGRVWHMITNANISSPMIWDALILLVYVIIGITFTRQLVAVSDGQKAEDSIKAISIVAFIAGLFVMVTSFIFSLQIARPLWNNAGQPISFLASAIVIAVALHIIIFAGLNRSGYIKISEKQLGKLGKIAAAFLLVELFIVLGEVVIGLYAGAGETTKIIQWLVVGEGKMFFWVEMLAIVAGLVFLFGKNTKMLIAGAAISILGVFMIKYNLIQAQLLNPLISYAGPPGYSGGEGVYLPSLIEIGVSVGIISIGGLLVMIGLDKLNLGEKTKLNTSKVTQSV